MIIQYCGKFTLVGYLIRVTLLRAVCIGNDDDADADDDDAVIPWKDEKNLWFKDLHFLAENQVRQEVLIK